MPQTKGTDRAVGKDGRQVKVSAPGSTRNAEQTTDRLTLVFLDTYAWTSPGGVVSESIPADFAAHIILRPIQSGGPLSRLLVLDPAWTAATISASIEAESCAGVRQEVCAEDAGRDRHVLRRDGRRHERTIRPHLLDRVRPRTGGACQAQVRTLLTGSNLLRRQSLGHA